MSTLELTKEDKKRIREKQIKKQISKRNYQKRKKSYSKGSRSRIPNSFFVEDDLNGV